MRRLAALVFLLWATQATAGPPAIQFTTPTQGEQRTWMPVPVTLDFDAGADELSLVVLLNGNDVTSDFTVNPPAGGRRGAVADAVWGGFVAVGPNLLEASVDLGGAPQNASVGFDASGDPFADHVVSYTLGTGGGFNAGLLPGIALGSPAGSGLFQGSLDVVSLGFDGSIVVEFVDNVVIDGPGVDFTVFENAFMAIGAGSLLEPPFAEPGRVSVSQDGVAWSAFACSLTVEAGPYWPGCAGVYPVLSDGTLATPHASIPTDVPIEDLVGQHILTVQVPPGSGGDSFDLADVGLPWIRFVRVEAASFATAPVGPDNAAFDLDAVAAVNSAPVTGVPALPWPATALLALALIAAGRRHLRRRGPDGAALAILLVATALPEPVPAAETSVARAPEPAAASVDATARGPSLESRLAEIQRRVQEVAHYPAIARAREQTGETLVSFEVGPDGRAAAVETVVSSGSTALDRAAVRAVERAERLPFVYGRVSIPVRFSLTDPD